MLLLIKMKQLRATEALVRSGWNGSKAVIRCPGAQKRGTNGPFGLVDVACPLAAFEVSAVAKNVHASGTRGENITPGIDKNLLSNGDGHVTRL